MENIVYYCPTCGDTYQELNSNSKFKCNFCNTQLLSTEMTTQQILEPYNYNDSNNSFENIIFINFISSKNTFNKHEYDKRQKYISKIDMSFIRPKDYLPIPIDDIKNDSKVCNDQQHIPKCPTCGSTNLSKISGTNKVGSAVLFGVFSLSHLGKTFKCGGCGYKW